MVKKGGATVFVSTVCTSGNKPETIHRSLSCKSTTSAVMNWSLIRIQSNFPKETILDMKKGQIRYVVRC